MPLQWQNKEIMGPVVFLDRDGVINIDSPDYVKTPEEFKFINNSPEAVSFLCKNGFSVIVITNQSLIGRKMADQETLDRIFTKMKLGIKAAGGDITDIFFCPHLPRDGCTCRKPEPGMILSARDKYGIDLARSVMVGDSTKDIVCGKNAGCGRTILVRTGKGEKSLKELKKKEIFQDHTADDLYSAALWIVENLKSK